MPLYWAGLWDAVNIAPGRVEPARGEVDEVGRRQPEVDDVDALRAHALGEAATSSTPDGRMSCADRARGRRPAKRAKAAPIARAMRRVELVGDDAPDVVGLEDRVEVACAGDLVSSEDVLVVAMARRPHESSPTRSQVRSHVSQLEQGVGSPSGVVRDVLEPSAGVPLGAGNGQRRRCAPTRYHARDAEQR